MYFKLIKKALPNLTSLHDVVEIAIEKFIVAFRQKKNLGIVRPRDSKMLLKHETILYDDGLGWF